MFYLNKKYLASSNLSLLDFSPRSSRAYKVAGLTLLACVLIAGQAMIAYFLLSQRSDIRSLEEQNNKLSMQMTSGQSGEKAGFWKPSVSAFMITYYTKK